MSLELNMNKEFILAGDISASMSEGDKACGDVSKYEYMLEKFKTFIQAAEDFDEHGAPTILLFGQDVHVFEHCKLADISKDLSRVKFEGFTNLHLVVEKAFDIHEEEKVEQAQAKKFHPGTVLLVFTDGQPTNKQAVKRTLEDIVRRVETEDEFQVVFIIVGSVDRALAAYLEGLHDDLEDKRINPRDFDIIHIERLEDISFTGAVGAYRHDGEKVA